MRSFTFRRGAPDLHRALVAGALSLALLAVPFAQGSVRAQTTAAPLPIQTGAGTGTVAANFFFPPAATVRVGDTVRWTIASDEVHTVTFGQPPAGGPPGALPPSTFPAPPPGPPSARALGPVTYSGTEFINTDIIFKGSTLDVRFTTAGTFKYMCVIHPDMTGTINVVAAGQPATSVSDATAQALQLSQQALAPANNLRVTTQNAQTLTNLADGTRRFSDQVGPFQDMDLNGDGRVDGYLELTEYIPANITIQQGDSIRWASNTNHTVTFLPPGAQPAQFDAFETPPSKPSSVYDGKSLYNSGVFNVGPPGQAPNSFELTFNQPGTYRYYCLLHWPNGHVGTVTVTAAAVTQTTPTATGTVAPSTTSGAAGAVTGTIIPPRTGLGEGGGSSTSLAVMLVAMLGTAGLVLGGRRLTARPAKSRQRD